VLAGIVQLWDESAIPHSHVVGLGFGGSVSLALALIHPDRVDRVVACCCRPRQPDNRRDFWRQRIAAAYQDMQALGNATVDRWLSEEFRHTHPELDRELRTMIGRTRSEGYQAYVHAFIEMDFEAQLESITRPVMLIAAEHDHGGGPVEAMQAMQQKIPGSLFEVIRDSGHICNYERPERVTELIRGFLG
jgi:3-oxoadipate enol-lactonase